MASVAGHCLAEAPHHRPSMTMVLRGLLIASVLTRYFMKQEYSPSRTQVSPPVSVEDRTTRPASPDADEAGVRPPDLMDERARSPASPNTVEAWVRSYRPPDKLSCMDGRIVILLFSLFVVVLLNSIWPMFEEFDD